MRLSIKYPTAMQLQTENCGLLSPRNYPEHFSLEILLQESNLKVAASVSWAQRSASIAHGTESQHAYAFSGLKALSRLMHSAVFSETPPLFGPIVLTMVRSSYTSYHQPRCNILYSSMIHSVMSWAKQLQKSSFFPLLLYSQHLDRTKM